MRRLGSWKGMVAFTLSIFLGVLVYSYLVGKEPTSTAWRVLLVPLVAPLMYIMFKYLDASGLPLLVRLMIIMGFFAIWELLYRVLTMLGIPVR